MEDTLLLLVVCAFYHKQRSLIYLKMHNAGSDVSLLVITCFHKNEISLIIDLFQNLFFAFI